MVCRERSGVVLDHVKMAMSEAHPIAHVRARTPARGSRVPLALAGALVCAGAVTMAATNARSDAAFGRALLELLIVGVPLAVGLYALRAPINATFGIALLVIGFAWSLTALTESSSSVLYTIGRLSTWLTFPSVVYLLLAFPHGRIARGLDRALLIATVAVIVVLFYGTAPFVEAFPPKTLWGTCTTDCPANALFALDTQPAQLMKVIYVREWLVELLWIGLCWSMFRRWRAASPLQQRAMGPAFLAGALLGVSHYAHITARQVGVNADTVIALSSVWTFCIVLVCVGFLCGLVWRRMLLAQALAIMDVALRFSPDRRRMQEALATALSDPTAQLLLRDPDANVWRDAHERPVSWPPARATAASTAHGVAFTHDRAVLDDRELLDGALDVLMSALDHERLTSELEHAMTEVQDSRRRIAEAADLERARIERDLHDGAQQRLIALRIRLGMAEELLKADPAAGARTISELGFEAEAALDELRAVAHGVYPPLLTDRGVVDALRSVAVHLPLPLHVTALAVTRHPIDIESATYFSCVEAIQNALKHGHGATGVWIELSQTRTHLHVEVRDDGSGFIADQADGRGLRNMHDRIEAIAGDLTIQTSPGHGTRVTCSIPLD
jgi:signal transduction histidine kinase